MKPRHGSQKVEKKSEIIALLEKEAIIINNPGKCDLGELSIPNVQSCICLILWHPQKAIVMHANGSGNDVATCQELVNQFEGINPREIKATIVGGYFTEKRSSFMAELHMWALRSNSNAIAHPILSILKAANIQLATINKNDASDNALVTLTVATGEVKIEKICNERAFIKNIENELKRRAIPKNALEAYMNEKMSNSTPYKLFNEISLLRKETALQGPVDNCGDTMRNWFPSI